MDIYFTEMKGNPATTNGSRIRLPTLPEKISMKTSAGFLSFNIMGQGEMILPGGSDLISLSWDGVFYGAARKYFPSDFMREWQDPETLRALFDKWRSEHQQLQISVTGTGINYDVYISSFDPVNTGAFGDISYSIELKQAHNPTIGVVHLLSAGSISKSLAANGSSFTCDTHKTVKIAPGGKYTALIYCSAGRPRVVAGTRGVVDISLLSQNGNSWYYVCTSKGGLGMSTGIYINGSSKPTFICLIDLHGWGAKSQATAVSSKKTYTVGAGDDLWGIAVKVYRNGSKWSTIYSANKAKIEAAAKQHYRGSSQNGRYIYPGEKLIIP
jgi:hypothetical protein